MLLALVERHGWPELGSRIAIRCFNHEPSVASSLKFLRRTPWARAAVEQLYLAGEAELARKRKRNQERKARRAHAAAVRAGGGESGTGGVGPGEVGADDGGPDDGGPDDGGPDDGGPDDGGPDDGGPDDAALPAATEES